MNRTFLNSTSITAKAQYLFVFSPFLGARNVCSKNSTDTNLVKLDIFADIGDAKNNSILTIQVRTGKFQKKDETSVFSQPDYRINSITDLPYILGVTKYF